jgi:CubicO group peptidase (beta-lactamase class C family)
VGVSERLTKLIERHIAEGGFTGAAVIGTHKNKKVLEHYAGNVAPDLQSSRNVLWPIASISKMYAVSAIMSLIERGEVTLNTLASDILPKFTGEGRETIRLRHLLTHTSGLIYESPEMEQRLIDQTPLEHLITEAYTAPLVFKPGNSFKYADYNTLIAGRVVEVSTGKPLPELVRELVLEPMKLKNTFFPTPKEEDARVAVVRGALGQGTHGDMYNSRYGRSLAHPAFAVTATANDLMTFASHFAPGGPRIHSQATVRAMTTNQTGVVTGIHPTMKGYDETASMPWGLGFALQTEWVPALLCELASFRTFGHGGATGCQMMIDPENEVIIAVLTNAHLNTGREAWYKRLQSIINVSFVTALEAKPRKIRRELKV